MSVVRRSLYEDVDRLWGRGIRRIQQLERALHRGADPRPILEEYRRLQQWFRRLEALWEQTKEAGIA